MTKIDIGTAENDKVIEITVEEIKEALKSLQGLKTFPLNCLNIDQDVYKRQEHDRT